MGNIMRRVTITRTQYEKIKEVFEMYDTLEYISLTETGESGIGPTTKIEFIPPTNSVTVDITDVSSW